jgi:hypothetical protein
MYEVITAEKELMVYWTLLFPHFCMIGTNIQKRGMLIKPTNSKKAAYSFQFGI